MALRIHALQLQDAIEKDFHCERCGHCCKGDGLVHVDEDEVAALGAALGLTQDQFLRQYTHDNGLGNWVLKDRMVASPHPGASPEQWCIFLERGSDGLYGCAVNSHKPRQCGRFPALWRNSDSFATCAGLRRLLADLKAHAAGEK